MEVWLHWDGAKVMWAIARCDACSAVQEFLGSDAAASVVTCGSCGAGIDLRGHVPQAVRAGNDPIRRSE